MENPYICIDTRKGRIRLNRQCYDELQQPNFIKILVNPEKAQLGIQRADTMEPEASRLRKEYLKHGHADIYCPSLVRDLVSEYHFEEGASYRIRALACLDHDMLIFSLNSVIAISYEEKINEQEETNDIQTACG